MFLTIYPQRTKLLTFYPGKYFFNNSLLFFRSVSTDFISDFLKLENFFSMLAELLFFKIIPHVNKNMYNFCESSVKLSNLLLVMKEGNISSKNEKSSLI